MRPICLLIDSSDRITRPGPAASDAGLRLCFALALLLTGCGAAPSLPTLAGGAWLTEDPNVACRHAPAISHSPDGSWLLFWLEDVTESRATPWPAISVGLIDLATDGMSLPAAQTQQNDPGVFTSFQPASLCWDGSDGAAYLRTESGYGWVDGGWFKLRPSVDAVLESVGEPPAGCVRPVPKEWRWASPATDQQSITRGLSVSQPSPYQLVLSLESGEVLATHRPWERSRQELTLSRYAWSPQGSWLAYLIAAQASGLPGESHLSVLASGDGSVSYRLDTRVHALFWLDDKTLLACADRPRSEGGGFGLKRWSLAAAVDR